MTVRDPFTRAMSLLVLGLCSVVLRWLSLPSLFFCLVALLITPREPRDPRLRRTWAALWLAALCTLIGLTRFVYLDAVPGIVQGGEQAVMQRAVSHLREILRVEDALRATSTNDADADGIGSAGLIGELAGVTPLRHGFIERPPLNKRFQSTVDTPIGPAAAIDGYLFVVCLPTIDGGYSARPGSSFDEESSEREFYAFAWPMDRSRNSFAIDATDRILVRSNAIVGANAYFGQLHPPDCAAVANDAAGDGWLPWRGKHARKGATLPKRANRVNQDG